MKSLSGINVTDMNTLLQLSGTMGALTQNPENLSPTTQVRQKLICKERTYQNRNEAICSHDLLGIWCPVLPRFSKRSDRII